MPTSRSARVTAAVDGLVDTWRDVSHVASRLPARAEERFGLTANRLAALLAIVNGAVRVQDVAGLTWTSTSATSRTVDALVRDDLVDRRPDPEDRRATVLTLTAKGHALADELLAWRREIMEAVVHALGTDRALGAVEVLGDLQRAMGGVLDGMAPEAG